MDEQTESALIEGGNAPEARGEDSNSINGYTRHSITECRQSSSYDYRLSTSDFRSPLSEGQPVPYTTILEATNNFGNLLGSGGFGSVYRGTLPVSKVEVAVKKLDAASRQGHPEFMTEVLTICQLRHRNVVKLIGWCCEGDSRLLVYEYADGGSLDKYVWSDSPKCLNWVQRYTVVKNLTDGLSYLHEHTRQKVIHRDIKCSNIMLRLRPGQGKDASNLVAMFGDFGLSRMMSDDQLKGIRANVAGTRGYMAPELDNGEFTCKTDIYALGIVFLQIVTAEKHWCDNCFEHQPFLVDRVREKFHRGRLLDAVDSRIVGAMDWR